ncbi:hypothetical protein [Nevskia sp.]|uniref:hypothetical protein n=1 Tax=Nevskia sp. TaxID=1929292 RepID=UPI0025D62829|nr:hypothetical protein [Nevskia sp.]
MSNKPHKNFRRQQRADLGRLVMIGIAAAVMVGAARAVTAQDAPIPTPAPEAPAPAPNPAPAPSSGGSKPSVDVSADNAVDFPGDI